MLENKFIPYLTYINLIHQVNEVKIFVNQRLMVLEKEKLNEAKSVAVALDTTFAIEELKNIFNLLEAIK